MKDKKTPGNARSASVEQPLLIQELRQLIESARQQVAQTANAVVTLLYWQLGKRIYQEVLQEQRAEYGEEILPTLSAKLVKEYGNTFDQRLESLLESALATKEAVLVGGRDNDQQL